MSQQEIIENGGVPAGFCKGKGAGMGYFNETCMAGSGNCEGYEPKNTAQPATCGNCKFWIFAGFGEY